MDRNRDETTSDRWRLESLSSTSASSGAPLHREAVPERRAKRGKRSRDSDLAKEGDDARDEHVAPSHHAQDGMLFANAEFRKDTEVPSYVDPRDQDTRRIIQDFLYGDPRRLLLDEERDKFRERVKESCIRFYKRQITLSGVNTSNRNITVDQEAEGDWNESSDSSGGWASEGEDINASESESSGSTNRIISADSNHDEDRPRVHHSILPSQDVVDSVHKTVSKLVFPSRRAKRAKIGSWNPSSLIALSCLVEEYSHALCEEAAQNLLVPHPSQESDRVSDAA